MNPLFVSHTKSSSTKLLVKVTIIFTTAFNLVLFGKKKEKDP